ncbi:methyltransferase [Nemania sp. FL0916]|nr:methyltransferase [Nemania sp. FL0916]
MANLNAPPADSTKMKGLLADQVTTDVGWYAPKPILHWPARQLLEQYSGIHPSEMVDELIKFRDRAWNTYPFPCVGLFDFIDLALSTRNRLYPRLLYRLQAGATLLDIGCCLGQDIRKLVFDGVPAENVAGAELRQGFIDLGYELFRDKKTLASKMYQANVLDDSSVGPWPQLEGTFDVVNFSMVLHVFPRDEQISMFERGVKVLKTEKLGTTILGTACGGDEPSVEMWYGTPVMIHNPETFQKLIEEVGEKTGTKWKVEVALDNYMSIWEPKFQWIGPTIRRLVWELTRVA